MNRPHVLSCLTVLEQAPHWREGRLTPAQGVALAEHFAQCPTCHALHVAPEQQRLETVASRLLEALDATLDLGYKNLEALEQEALEQEALEQEALEQEALEQEALAREVSSARMSADSPAALEAGALERSPWGMGRDTLQWNLNQRNPKQVKGSPGSTPRLPVVPVAELERCAIGLPEVPEPALLTGYHLELDAAGNIGPSQVGAVARIQVISSQNQENGQGQEGRGSVYLEALVDGIWLEDRPLSPGEVWPLKRLGHIGLPEGLLLYEPVAPEAPFTRGLLGLLHGGSERLRLELDQPVVLGRGSGCGLPLPDREDVSNLHWKPEFQAGERIAYRGRQVRRSAFTLDAYKIERRHAILTLRAGGVEAQALAHNALRIELSGAGEGLEGPSPVVRELRQGMMPERLTRSARLRVGHTLFQLHLSLPEA